MADRVQGSGGVLRDGRKARRFDAVQRAHRSCHYLGHPREVRRGSGGLQSPESTG